MLVHPLFTAISFFLILFFIGSHQTIIIINNQVVKYYIGRSSFAIHAIYQSMGREANSVQYCDDGVVAIIQAALPHCTSMEIFWVKNCVALLSPVYSMTQEPIRCINKCAQELHMTQKFQFRN